MMKDVTILTFDEIERIKYEIKNMIDEAREGAYGERDGKTVCNWLLVDLFKLQEMFE